MGLCFLRFDLVTIHFYPFFATFFIVFLNSFSLKPRSINFVHKIHCLTGSPIFVNIYVAIEQTFFFISNQVAKGSKIKNGLKVKQLAKQPPTSKMLIQKILIEFGVSNLTFSILSSLKLNFSTTVHGI